MIDRTDASVVYSGVWKSTDGGVTWSRLPVPTPRHLNAMVIDPANPSVLFAAERTGLYKADDLNWAVNRAQSGYAVLNACRALRLSREGVVCSKPEGGGWALDEGIGDAPVILAALCRQDGADEVVDTNAAALFATQVREELLREAATPSHGA